MFAIEITQENLPKIQEAQADMNDVDFDLDLYLKSPKTWYTIRGYVGPFGRVWTHNLAVLPKNVFDECYEYDPVKIRTDWDQIVRKS